jgi:MSHA pilin protein MshC
MPRFFRQTDVLPPTLQRGFTLVELIMVIVIVGILAVFVAPRFFDAGIFRSKGFADQVQASLRYAQKVAIAQRRVVCVGFDTVNSPHSITLTIDSDTPADGACNAAPAGNLQSPTGDASYKVNAPTNTTFAAVPADFSFDPQGRPSFAVTSTVSVTGAANAITIEAETGYVH